MNCKFCRNYHSCNEICAKEYCYEYIFKQFFISIWLKYQPSSIEKFEEYAARLISDNSLFSESPNPFPIMKYNLSLFIEEYDLEVQF